MNSITEYLRICRDEKRLGPKTLKLYERELVLLSQLETVDAIRAHLSKLAPASVDLKLTVWRSFAKVVLNEDLLKRLSVIHRPKMIQREPSFLSPEQTKKLRSLISTKSITEQLFFELGLSMGLRVAEIMSVQKSDFQDGWLRIIRKGNKQQMLPISDEVQKLLPLVTEEKPFTNCYVAYYNMVRRRGKEVGLRDTISPHSLRHTFATRMASSGKNMFLLQSFLGHSNISTTARYVHVTPEDLRRLVQKGKQ